MPSVGNGNSNRNNDRDGLIARGGKVDRETLYALYEQQADDDETPISATFKLSRDLNKRLDRYLVDRIPFLSRTSLQRLIKEDGVTVNGRIGKPATRLRAGDEIVAVLPPPPSAEIPAEEIPLDVLYEDDDLIVINKVDDIIVHPARGRPPAGPAHQRRRGLCQDGHGALAARPSVREPPRREAIPRRRPWPDGDARRRDRRPPGQAPDRQGEVRRALGRHG
jgi:hypothetical protein